MPNGGETITENFESSVNNLKIEHRESMQMTNTLRLLNLDNQTSFYKIEGEKVVYDMETVKKYLTHICKKEDGTLKTRKEMTDDIWAENIKAEIGGGSTTTWTTAVQIALEYLGYDVGKIDGNLGGDTEIAIKKFQKKCNLTVDGKPRPEVINRIIENIENQMINIKKLGAIEKYKFQEIKTKILENEKRLGLKGYLKFNADGSIEFTDKLMKDLSNRKTELKNNGINLFGEIETAIEKLLTGVMKSGECWRLEYKFENRTEKKYLNQTI